MKKLLTWTLVHATHWAVLYGAFGLGLDGAMYLLKFTVWLIAPLSLLFFWSEIAKSGAKQKATPIRAFLSRVQSWATLGLLVWFGHIPTALAWSLSMFGSAYHRTQVQKLRAEMQAT